MKRYQVFVSSTFVDLKEERAKVMHTLLGMDCIPAGMELFPALDDEQLNFIKRVIDDCDYYLIIIGGRYGSRAEDGLSFTEKEYDYALEKGMKVVALVHGEPGELPKKHTESDPAAEAALQEFREKVKKGRLVKFWNNANELPGLVALGMLATIKAFPAQGWIRGDRVASEDLLAENIQLRKKVDELEAAAKPRRSEGLTGIALAGLDETFVLEAKSYSINGDYDISVEMTWGKIFAVIGPFLSGPMAREEIGRKLELYCYKQHGAGSGNPDFDDQCLATIGIHLRALGLIDIIPAEPGQTPERWALTPEGERLTVELRVVRSRKIPGVSEGVGD